MLSSSSSWGWTGSDSLSEHAPCAGRMGGCVCAYCTRNVADEMFWWEMCGEERDLVVSENGVYGGGGPRVAVVSVELRGSTTGGEDGVKTLKRKGPLGKTAAAVAEDARLRGGELWPDEDALLRVVGVVFSCGREMVVQVDSEPGTGRLVGGSEWDIQLGRVRMWYDMDS